MAGSVFSANESLRRQFEGLFAKDFASAKLTPISKKPELGALYLAVKLAGR
jgi:hypothetical protein